MEGTSWDIFYTKIRELCLDYYRGSKKKTVFELLENCMDIENLPMHCPPHHFIMPAILLTRCHQEIGTPIEKLEADLTEADRRARNVLGGFCGNYGACGAAVGIGIFMSIFTGSGPLSEKTWSQTNRSVGEALLEISSVDGPRCCKRDCFLALRSACTSVEKYLGITLEKPEQITCRYFPGNMQCKKEKCPFYPHREDTDPKKTASRMPILVPHEAYVKTQGQESCPCQMVPVILAHKEGRIFWKKAEGDRVCAGEVVCEGEVDCKTVVFRAPGDGILSQICIPEQGVFRQGDILGYVGRPIALYLISGFLGAGKTTLLRRLLQDYSEQKTGVIVNEFGALGIDGTLVKRNGIEMVEINNGSIFCSCLKGAFVKTLLNFTESDIDVLFIENSGMADPSNMHRLLKELQGKTKREYQYQGAVCVLDAVTFQKTVQVLTPVENQVASSNLILINKADQVDQLQIDQIRKQVEKINPQAYICQTIYSEIPHLLLQEKLTDNGYDRETSNHPYNRMGTCALECLEEVKEQDLLKFLEHFRDRTYRIKGLVRTIQGWKQVECVDSRCLVTDFVPGRRDVIHHTRLVLIGKEQKNLSGEALETWEKLCKVKGQLYE